MRFRKQSPPPLDRERIAEIFLRGEGIEIGALHKPLKAPPSAKVTYIDRLRAAELRKHYPELAQAPFVEPQILDDGERLAKIEDSSQDFVIANHFLEHCQDPIRAIENFLRALRPGGVVFLAVPDMRFTFDRDRPAATLDHLLRDYREGPAWSRRRHFEEWVRIVNKVADDAWAEDRIAHYMAMDYSIHYHAWTQTDLLELFAMLRKTLHFPFEIECYLRLGEECLFILKKVGSSVDRV